MDLQLREVIPCGTPRLRQLSRRRFLRGLPLLLRLK
jgi:hypothetical protein